MSSGVVGPWDVETEDDIDRDLLETVAQAFPLHPPTLLLVGEGRHRIAALAVAQNLGVIVAPSSRVDLLILRSLAEMGSNCDVLVLVDGLERVRETTTATHFEELLSFCASAFRLCIFESPRLAIMRGTVDLGPYNAKPICTAFPFVTEFRSESTQRGIAAPRLIASRELLHTEQGWRTAEELGYQSPMSSSKAVLTLIGSAYVFKAQPCSPDYLEFSAVAHEAQFLRGVGESVRAHLRLPRVIDSGCGRAVSHLLRTRVSGDSWDGSAQSVPALIDALASAVRYAEVGLFHNDIRPWNVIWGDEGAHVVDYADVSPLESDTEGLPQVLALAATLALLRNPGMASSRRFSSFAWARWNDSPLSRMYAASDLLGNPWLALGNSSTLDVDWSSTERVFTSILRTSLGIRDQPVDA